MNSILSLSISFLIGSLLLAGCSTAPMEKPKALDAVTVSYPVERQVTDYADFTARTAPIDSVEVRARVSGYVDQVKFTEGGLVKKGDLLVVIDPRPYVAELNRAKAQHEQAKAAQVQATTQLQEAQAQESRVLATLPFLTSRLERSRRLVRGNTVTQEELEKHDSELNQAKADLNRAKAQVASAKAAINTAAANVESAQAAEALAQLNLEYTNVVAPISGRISRKLVTEGNLVQVGQLGTPLTNLVSVDPIYAYFDVDEHTVLRVRQLIREGKARSAREGDLPVRLELANEKGFPHHGTINFVDNQVNPKTGTLRLRGVFRNADESLAPGLFGRVRVPIGQPHDALLVNDRAIDSDQGQKILYVLNEKNEVTTRAIRVGALHNGLREITDGLQPRDRVVVAGLQRTRQGVTVEPKLVAMPGLQAPPGESQVDPASVASLRSPKSN